MEGDKRISHARVTPPEILNYFVVRPTSHLYHILYYICFFFFLKNLIDPDITSITSWTSAFHVDRTLGLALQRTIHSLQQALRRFFWAQSVAYFLEFVIRIDLNPVLIHSVL